MKTFNAALHLRRKTALLCALAFVAAFLLLSIITSISVNADLSQINALMRSEYDYSATAQSSSLENTYYQYNAGISFTVAEDSGTRLNADVLMQTEANGYSDAVFWNSKPLSRYGVAVSKGMADSHGLTVGDVIYSKHIVDGTIHQYTIEDILPAVTTARVTSTGNHSDGILIMGYDEQYATNISHISIIFTDEPIEAAADKCSEMPTNILYRDDEILTLVKHSIPYMLLFVFLTAVCMTVVTLILIKEVSHNFKRLAASGAGYRSLNNAYYKLIMGIGVGLILLSGIISAVSFAIVDVHALIVVPTLLAVVGELIALTITAAASNKQMWRK